MEPTDYEVVQLKDGSPLTGDLALRVQNFRFVKGLCAVNPDEPTRPRDREWYLDNVIKLLLREGAIDDGTRTPHDDRKFRVDRLALAGGTLQVRLGISHYHAFQADLRRSDEENQILQERGRINLNDRWAYFQRNPGVAGLVLSASGSVYGGKRTNADATNAFNSVAGHLKYQENPAEVNLLDDLSKELAEEMGITTEEVRDTRFVGAYGHPIQGHFDFTWIVRTNLPNDYFSSTGSWKERRKSPEHEELIRLASPAEVHSLLENGRIPGLPEQFRIMYSTRGALLSLKDEDFRSL